MKKIIICLLFLASFSAQAVRESGGKRIPNAIFLDFVSIGSGIHMDTFKKYERILKEEKKYIFKTTFDGIGREGERVVCVQFKDSKAYNRSIYRLAASIRKDKKRLTRLLVSFSCDDINRATEQSLKGHEQAVVMLHGAHFNKNSYAYLKAELKKHSIKSVALNLLGSDGANVELSQVASHFCQQLKKIKDHDRKKGIYRRLVILAHSQAGGVVNKALETMRCANYMSEIIYLAAVVPLQGETIFEKLSKEDGDNYMQGIEQRGNQFVVANAKKFLATFAQLVPRSRQNFVLKSSHAEGLKIGEGTVDHSWSFKRASKFYIKTTRDKIISPATQNMFIKRSNMTRVYSVDSDHLPMVSAPKELAKILSSHL